MPVYHFTFHAYRSWNADHERGYLQRGEKGIKKANIPLAYMRDRLASEQPVKFNKDEAKFLVEPMEETVARRGWELYGVTVTENHLHAVVSWPTAEFDAQAVQARLKRALGYLLAKRNKTQRKSYFSRGGVPKLVKNMNHLRFLLAEYFPKHHGVFWRAEIIK